MMPLLVADDYPRMLSPKEYNNTWYNTEKITKKSESFADSYKVFNHLHQSMIMYRMAIFISGESP